MISLGIFCTILPYGVNNFVQMSNYESTMFQSMTSPNQENNTLSLADQNIAFAFALVNTNNIPFEDYSRYLYWRAEIRTYR